MWCSLGIEAGFGGNSINKDRQLTWVCEPKARALEILNRFAFYRKAVVGVPRHACSVSDWAGEVHGEPPRGGGPGDLDPSDVPRAQGLNGRKQLGRRFDHPRLVRGRAEPGLCLRRDATPTSLIASHSQVKYFKFERRVDESRGFPFVKIT